MIENAHHPLTKYIHNLINDYCSGDLYLTHENKSLYHFLQRKRREHVALFATQSSRSADPPVQQPVTEQLSDPLFDSIKYLNRVKSVAEHYTLPASSDAPDVRAASTAKQLDALMRVILEPVVLTQ